MQSLELVEIADVYPYEREDGEPMNPRDFTTRESAEHIAALAEQFRRNRLNPGQPVMKPILYRDGGIYWIIDGECRVRAMRSIGTKRFLAEVYDDLADAEVARAEAAKAMVETDAKLGLSAAEKSRGVQTMLALDLPDEEVAAAARTDAATVRKARRAVRRVQDAAYDMTLDRLAAIADFEGDEDAVARLRDCRQSEWQSVHRELERERDRRRSLDALLAAARSAGVEVVPGCPDGFRAARTFGVWRAGGDAELGAYLASREGDGLLATEDAYGLTVLERADPSEGEREREEAQARADFLEGMDEGAAARGEWVAAHVGDLGSMRRTARALTEIASRGWEAKRFAELVGRPLDLTPSELSVAAGWAESWRLTAYGAWGAVNGDLDWLDEEDASSVVEVYEAMEADGWEPTDAERRTYGACKASLESKEDERDE